MTGTVNAATAGNYYRAGRGKVMECYITDEELNEILNTGLPAVYEAFTLIVVEWDGDKTFYHKECTPGEFLELRKKGIERFYLRSKKLTPEIELPADPVSGGTANSNLQKAYLYNGLLDIQHGFLLEKKYFQKTTIGFIDKYFPVGQPEQVTTNAGYDEVFRAIRKKITPLLKFKSKTVLKDGRVFPAKKADVTTGFNNGVMNNTIVTNIEIVD